ncbi:N-lysine methyltransferase setd6-like isoform X2 [Huso huso]|uniref:N-lysine methyltransferase SETD6 n=1 Tax=Huso huso TaxID=61971 RepID=A0ABR0Z5K5_HUSHU
MATDAKRPKDNGASAQNPGEDKTLQSFLSWCKEVRLELSEKVYVSREGTVADYGMLAREEIEEGEVIFSIPRAALLNQHRTAIHSILEKAEEGCAWSPCLSPEEESLKSQSGWVPLLLALMFEYTNSESYWSPYLSLWTDFRALDHPMFWPKEERERLLQGTGVPEAVEKDLANILKEYNDIVLPFIQSHREVLDPQKHTLELYQSLVAFVMAYSFQEPLEEDEEDEKEPNPPMMVPMADILNHVANHNANLEFRTESLKMVSVRRIKKGEEVFNTYGELANWQLLHMYGFVESYPSNTNDSADIQMTTVYKAALQAARTESERSLVVEKWDLLCQLDIVGEERAFVFGQSGSLTDEELYTSLKVLCMPVEQFKEFKENEGWEEAEEDDEDEMAAALSNEGIPKLSLPWRRLLGDSVTLTLQDYADKLQPDKELLGDRQAYGRLSSRERLALQLRYGQKVTLHQLLELTRCHSI